jgi:hypothetical protein
MKTFSIRIFSVMLVALMLVLVGQVILSRSGVAASIADPVAPQSRAYAISSDQASIIAQDNAPRAAVIGTPTLTTIQGSVAYAVSLDVGTIFVEASTGRILVNTVALARLSEQHY